MQQPRSLPAGALCGCRVRFPFLILSLAAAAKTDGRVSGFCVFLDWSHCQCHVLAPKQEAVQSQMQTNTASDQNVAFARSLHVISAIHAQLHTADCICCVLKSHFMPHLPFMQIAFNWIYLASTPYLFLLRVSRICIGRSRRRDGREKRFVVERFLVVGLYLHRGIKSLLFSFLCTFVEFSSI